MRRVAVVLQASLLAAFIAALPVQWAAAQPKQPQPPLVPCRIVPKPSCTHLHVPTCIHYVYCTNSAGKTGQQCDRWKCLPLQVK